MHNRDFKRAILHALGPTPECRSLAMLPDPSTKSGASLLRWLDRTGLALYFWRSLLSSGRSDRLPIAWRDALAQRLSDNSLRTADMLAEFAAVQEAFHRRGIRAVALKGFSLVPDFCENPADRHQADFDFLVTPAEVRAVAEVLTARGYSAPRLCVDRETCFTTPLHRIPSSRDYLYHLQHQRQLDLHVSLWEPSPWFELPTPASLPQASRRKIASDIDILSLSLPDHFYFQVLHVFRHSMKSWLRLSWLYELGHCVRLHAKDAALWLAVRGRAGESALARRAMTHVLGLVQLLFAVPLPPALDEWLSANSPSCISAWHCSFGFDWATSDWPGSLSNLLLASEFMPDPKLRHRYVQCRLLPLSASTSIGAVAGSASFLQLQMARARYAAGRSAAHLRDLLALPVQLLRWWRISREHSRSAPGQSNSGSTTIIGRRII